MPLGSRALLVASLVVGLALCANGQSRPAPRQKSPAPPTPVWRISFQPGDPISGFIASPVVKGAYQCTSDGTVFTNFIENAAEGAIIDTLHLPLASISPSKQVFRFQIAHVDGLHDVQEIDHFASESEVVFLVSAALEDKPTKQRYRHDDGSISEETINGAPYHRFAIIFDREAKFQSTIQLDDAFEVQQLGIFPSGLFLAYGFDEVDRSSKIALLNSDGTILKYLQMDDGVMPKTAFGKPPNWKGPEIFVDAQHQSIVLRSVQFVAFRTSIVVVQSQTRYPLVEVSESGAVRVIHPKLPDGVKVNSLIASDANLFAIVGKMLDGSRIFELSPRTGAALRRFRFGQGESSQVACVHDGTFLSFENGRDGALVPMVGTGERDSDAPPENRAKR